MEPVDEVQSSESPRTKRQIVPTQTMAPDGEVQSQDSSRMKRVRFESMFRGSSSTLAGPSEGTSQTTPQQGHNNDNNDNNDVEMSTAGTTEVTKEFIIINPDGDVIFRVSGSAANATTSFLVSSRILSFTSEPFRTMLDSKSPEHRPTITLEDDAEAMETIFRVLHHQHNEVKLSMDPKCLLTLAIHSDKYQTNEAMRPWATQWCIPRSEVTESEDLGRLLLAAYLFRISNFSSIAAKVATLLKPGFKSSWLEHGILERLPSIITGIERASLSFATHTYKATDSLAELIDETCTHLHAELQDVEKRLRANKRAFDMIGYNCDCGVFTAQPTQRCFMCQKSTFRPRFCNSDSRVSQYFLFLGEKGLWPSTDLFANENLSTVVSRFGDVLRGNNHWCAASSTCYLHLEISATFHGMQAILESMEGFRIEGVADNRD
jgi:hypothetical protein